MSRKTFNEEYPDQYYVKNLLEPIIIDCHGDPEIVDEYEQWFEFEPEPRSQYYNVQEVSSLELCLRASIADDYTIVDIEDSVVVQHSDEKANVLRSSVRFLAPWDYDTGDLNHYERIFYQYSQVVETREYSDEGLLVNSSADILSEIDKLLDLTSTSTGVPIFSGTAFYSDVVRAKVDTMVGRENSRKAVMSYLNSLDKMGLDDTDTYWSGMPAEFRRLLEEVVLGPNAFFDEALKRRFSTLVHLSLGDSSNAHN